MQWVTKTQRTRRGAVAPLTAIMLIPLLAMLAFSVDMGYMVVVKSDLQDTADASSLAGAETLKSLYVQYMQNPQSTVVGQATGTTSGSPKKVAETFAGYNTAGGVAVSVPDADVSFGSTDSSGTFSTTYTGFPNTVAVTTRRDSTANGELGLFFAPVLGQSTKPLRASARATVYVGNITTFQNLGVNGLMLPVTLDVNEWSSFYTTGQSPDGNTYTGSNGKPQLQVYPDPGNAPGQFALLSVGPPATDVGSFSTWIDNGPTSTDIQYLLDHSQLPVSRLNPKVWSGGPGDKSTLLSDFASQMGTPRLLPLFKPISTSPYQAASGSGSGATYNIVGFAQVTISQASGNGSNMNISVQPIPVNDPTAVWSWTPADSNSSTTTYITGVSSTQSRLSY